MSSPLVVLDTMVVVSAIGGRVEGPSAAVVRAVATGDVRLAISDDQLAELVRVMGYEGVEKRLATWQTHLLVPFVIMSSLEQDAYDECANGWGFVSMEHHSTIRWYNPQLEDFEWREVPTTDEQALEALGGSPHSPACTQTYREWRELGAFIGVALMRAGEAAKAERDEQA